MRYYIFLSLAATAILLDMLFLGLIALFPREPQYAEASHSEAESTLTLLPTPSSTATRVPATSTPTPTATATATSTATPTATPTATAAPTATPVPRVLAENSVSFTPTDKAVRANIDLALAHYQSALMHVFVAPGGTFSFNAALGPRPQHLPWKYVQVRATATADPEGTPQPDFVQNVQGGGLCDLASRYVMAARPLLPNSAFKYVNHLRSNGIRLHGVPDRDAVSIWAVGGQPGEQDLKITNTTNGWLEFVVERDGPKITVRARLWDHLPSS